eukprot:355490-Chlamydomonas_euryale.AAC.8
MQERIYCMNVIYGTLRTPSAGFESIGWICDLLRGAVRDVIESMGWILCPTARGRPSCCVLKASVLVAAAARVCGGHSCELLVAVSYHQGPENAFLACDLALTHWT